MLVTNEGFFLFFIYVYKDLLIKVVFADDKFHISNLFLIIYPTTIHIRMSSIQNNKNHISRNLKPPNYLKPRTWLSFKTSSTISNTFRQYQLDSQCT